ADAPCAAYDVRTRAPAWCRQRKGPTLVPAHVTRPYSHSLSDDEILYKPPREREEEAKRDPVATFPKRLLADGVATESEIEAIKAQVEEEIQVAADMALASPQPKAESALLWVYSPDVERVRYCGDLSGGAVYKSQTGAVVFTAVPGLRVICPSTALDANGLLRTAIRCDDPVLFLEHKHLYRQTYNKAPNPGPNFMIPFGKAKVVRPGTALTVVTYGAVVQRALVAAKELEEKDGVSVEVIDLRSLSPVDWDAIGASVRKTSRVIVAYDDAYSWGYGAEIAARIADQCFPWLDAPVRRV